MYVIGYDIVYYVSYLILCLCTGAMFHYNKDSTTYGLVCWYTKFKPSCSAVVSVGDPELGAVVQVGGVDGAAPPAKKPQYSLTLNDVSASPCAAPGPAAPAAADEGGDDAAHKVSS